MRPDPAERDDVGPWEEFPQPDSRLPWWIRALTGTGAAREAGLTQLHDLLVRVAVRELRRREAGAWISGRELDDLAHQAADDAMLAILGKLGSFRAKAALPRGRTG